MGQFVCLYLDLLLKRSEVVEDGPRPRPSAQCPVAGDGEVGVWADPGHEWSSRQKPGPSGAKLRPQGPG